MSFACHALSVRPGPALRRLSRSSSDRSRTRSASRVGRARRESPRARPAPGSPRPRLRPARAPAGMPSRVVPSLPRGRMTARRSIGNRVARDRDRRRNRRRAGAPGARRRASREGRYQRRRLAPAHNGLDNSRSAPLGCTDGRGVQVRARARCEAAPHLDRRAPRRGGLFRLTRAGDAAPAGASTRRNRWA